MKPLHGLAAIFALLAGTAAPALAVEFTTSSTTGKGLLFFPVRGETPRLGPLSVDLGMRFAPYLSEALGPSRIHAGLSEVTSSLVDASSHLYYHHQLADIEFLGRFNPVVAPYVGMRYLGVPTTEGTVSLTGAGPGASAAVSYSQFTGVDYGVRAYTDLPLGFRAFANVGLTTLLGGGWDTRVNSPDVTGAGRVATHNMTMPAFAVGADWTFFDVIALNASYELFTLPTGLRAQGTALPVGQTTLNAINLGARILFVRF
ncbi:MAG: hypothetical protein ACK46X_13830 [Candidatus Sericytochromatia bacterium]